MSGPPDDFKNLVQELSDADPEVRASAASKLMGSEDTRAVEPLLRALEDESPRVRAMAALGLAHYEAEEAVPALLDYLANDSASDVRAICAFALGRIGNDQALDGLIPALNDPDRPVRGVACSAFACAKDRRAVSQIMQLIDDPHWDVRLDACETLVRLEVADERLVDGIERLRQDPQAAEHEKGMMATHQFLQTLLNNPDARICTVDGRPISDRRWAGLEEVLERARERLGEEGFGDPPPGLAELAERARRLVEESHG